MAVEIYEYMDYREFIKDWFRHEKRTRRRFTVREFARRAGFNSTGFLNELMAGRRHLSKDWVEKFLKVMGLLKYREIYFRCLVAFSKAKTYDKKNIAYKNLVDSNRKFGRTEEYYLSEVYRDWYNPVILNLLRIRNVKNDYDSLASLLRPAIRNYEARASIKLFKRLKLIRKNKEGFWKPVKKAFELAYKSGSIGRNNLHKSAVGAFLKRANIIDNMEKVSTIHVAMSLSENALNDVSREVLKFKKSVEAIALADYEKVDRVSVLTMQFCQATKDFK